jgi:PleD family two-component response regulator
MPFPQPQHRILYVGTGMPLKSTIQHHLADSNALVIYCPDHPTAHTFIRSTIPYHLFIFDEHFPYINPLSLTQLARSLPHRHHTPIIILSSNPKGHPTGPTTLIKKPPQIPHLLNTITRLLTP